MADTLRDRIIAALLSEDDVALMADAVIRELGPLVRYWDKDFKELHYCRECGGWGPKDD